MECIKSMYIYHTVTRACFKHTLERHGGLVDWEWKRRIYIVGIVAGVYLGFRYVLPPAVPFLIGWGLAVWLYPLSVRIEKKIRVKKSVVGGFLMILLLAAAGLLLWSGVETLIGQLKAWLMNFTELQDKFYYFVDQCCCSLESSLGISRVESRKFILMNVEKIQNNFIQELSPRTIFQATDYLKGMIAVISSVLIAFISGVLFLHDLEDIRRALRTYRFYQPWRRVLKRLKQTCVTYLKAQMLIMVMIAFICTFMLWLMKSPYYLLFGMGLGILDALPIIGTGLFMYPAALIFFIRGQTGLAVWCLSIEVVTTLVREFMEPRLLGDKLGVYPVVIMAAIYFGFIVFGVSGFILGPVALSLVYGIGKEWDIWD